MTNPDHRPALFQSYELAARIVAGVQPGHLSGPTPCPDYNVGVLVDHLVGAGHRAAALGRGEAPTADEFPHVELVDAPAQLLQAGEAARSAWADDLRLVATIRMPWGEVYTGGTLVDMYLAELATHTWDMAVATDQVGRLDVGLAEPSLAAARAMLKPGYRNMLAAGSPFGSEVPAPGDANAWECLAAFMGREPRPVAVAS
jgi:uncharacterized protein (TIGR03086 family)